MTYNWRTKEVLHRLVPRMPVTDPTPSPNLRDRSREAAVLRKRLAEIESLIAWVDDLARSFLGGGVVPSLGLKALVASARRKRRRTER